MTPERRAEIETYVRRLDLNQLPPWTIEQAIIRDLWEALPEAWDDGFEAGHSWALDYSETANPYRDGERTPLDGAS